MLFRRDKGKALFVKADVSTTKKLTVVVPEDAREVHARQGRHARSPTRFRLRVLAAKLTKALHRRRSSRPVIGPEKASGTGGNSGGAGVPTAPDGDCDGDGVKNSVDLDDDNDLLADALELQLLLDPCVGDTDGDGVEDGFEYQSAVDLNNDDYQYAELRRSRTRARRRTRTRCSRTRDNDYDGDGLTSTRSTSSGSTRTRSTTPRRAR